MERQVFVILTMDCEPALFECSPLAIRLSGSGPADHEEGEQSIRGYVEAARVEGYPVTLFAHPEVAVAQSKLLRELQGEGACLGMHLHPYKFDPERYPMDLGGLPADKQREAISEAKRVWSDASELLPGRRILGQRRHLRRSGRERLRGRQPVLPRTGPAHRHGGVGRRRALPPPGRPDLPTDRRGQRLRRDSHLSGPFQAHGRWRPA